MGTVPACLPPVFLLLATHQLLASLPHRRDASQVPERQLKALEGTPVPASGTAAATAASAAVGTAAAAAGGGRASPGASASSAPGTPLIGSSPLKPQQQSDSPAPGSAGGLNGSKRRLLPFGSAGTNRVHPAAGGGAGGGAATGMAVVAAGGPRGVSSSGPSASVAYGYHPALGAKSGTGGGVMPMSMPMSMQVCVYVCVCVRVRVSGCE